MTGSAPIDAVIASILALDGRWNRPTSVASMRQDWDDFFRNRAALLPRRKVNAAGVPAAWITHWQRASPIDGDLRGLPPVPLQCGARETLVDDTVEFSKKARAAGICAEAKLFDGMIHVFQMFAAELVVAMVAIAQAGEFIRRHLRGG